MGGAKFHPHTRPFHVIPVPNVITLPILFVTGTCLGAIINLGIYRLAYFRRRISPWCRTRDLLPPRTWSDRIPILGWWSLRREAEFHGTLFWIRPMLLELCCGLTVAGLYWLEVVEGAVNVSPQMPGLRPGATESAALIAQFSIHVVLLFLMTVATFIDIDEQTVPDAITVPGTIIALLLAAWCISPALPAQQIDWKQPQPNQLILPLRFDYPDHLSAFLQGAASLAVGLAIYLGWCFALLPRRWRLGVGFRKAWRVMWRRIFSRPDWHWVLPLAVAGCAGIIAGWLHGGEAWRGLMTALVGLAVGGGMIWIIRLVGSATLQREAMGFGDVTLLAMIGAFIGWQPVMIVFFIAPFVGAVVGILQWIVIRDNVIPYGPFLCLAALCVMIFWAPMWESAGPMFEVPWLVPSAIAICLPVLAGLLYGWRLIKQRYMPLDY